MDEWMDRNGSIHEWIDGQIEVDKWMDGQTAGQMLADRCICMNGWVVLQTEKYLNIYNMTFSYEKTKSLSVDEGDTHSD